MPAQPLQPIALAKLPSGRESRFVFDVKPDHLAAFVSEFDLIDLRKVAFEVTLTPMGKRDWSLTGHLGATVVQPCAVTLAPVTTRIEEPLRRTYTAHLPELGDATEVEMPEDDTIEPLPEVIDPAALLSETLALGLPDFPRADGAELGEAVFSEPGVTPLTDEASRPFAGLAGLRDKLGKNS